ncbi:MAG: class I SAM-dependent methyltransferase [Armatimonadetes bacterium]|nr:class I SAM-dependent methyltransferase [Armatimonadota bacterium]
MPRTAWVSSVRPRRAPRRLLLTMPTWDPDLLEFEARMARRYRWLFANWEQAVANEGRRLDALLRSRGVRRVLDAACGAGRQAIALAEHGFPVVVSDISVAMLAATRAEAARRGLRIDYCAADFRALPFFGAAFDAALCCGNSLAHCLTNEQLRAALVGFRRAVHCGGILVADLRNYEPILRNRPRFHFRQMHERPEGRLLVFDVWDYHADGTLTFNVFFVEEGPEGWTTECLSTLQAPHLPEAFASALREAGFEPEDLRVTNAWVEVVAVAV